MITIAKILLSYLSIKSTIDFSVSTLCRGYPKMILNDSALNFQGNKKFKETRNWIFIFIVKQKNSKTKTIHS